MVLLFLIQGSLVDWMNDFKSRKNWFVFFCQSNNKWCFGVLKLLVNSGECFSRASLFRESVARGLVLVEKRSFDGFVSDLLADGLLVQGDWKTTEFGKEIPLSVSVFGERIFGENFEFVCWYWRKQKTLG